jgi:phospholipid/cholesterol/gamma-HCH transport system permease protein
VPISEAEPEPVVLPLVAKIQEPGPAPGPMPEVEEEPEEEFQENWLVRYLIRVGETVSGWLYDIGDFTLFVWNVFVWLLQGTRRGTLLPCMYEIGIMSLPVIALTGTFIGMVLAVQSYNQLKDFYLETRIGALINLSLVRELGPVLAATMLAGRIGSSMAAELGTMRVTEQIDALGSMGVNPIHYLVVPRFLGCVLLIPVLTIFADFMGVVGGAYFSVWIYNIDWHFYLSNSNKIVGEPDVFLGIFKSFFFGATIGLIGCHRGFNSRAGAQGVGRAATEAFVFSFVFILLEDLALGTLFESVESLIFPHMPRQL